MLLQPPKIVGRHPVVLRLEVAKGYAGRTGAGVTILNDMTVLPIGY